MTDNITGTIIAEYTALTDTSATTVYTARKTGGVIDQIRISNPTGGAVSVVVDIYDGTSVLHQIDPGSSVAATTSLRLSLDAWPIKAGQTIRVTSVNLVQVAVLSYANVYGHI